MTASFPASGYARAVSFPLDLCALLDHLLPYVLLLRSAHPQGRLRRGCGGLGRDRRGSGGVSDQRRVARKVCVRVDVRVDVRMRACTYIFPFLRLSPYPLFA